MAEGTAIRKQGVRKNLKSPDETRRFDKGKIDIANVGEAVIGRFQRQPGCSSNLPITASPTLAMSILPLSNLRVSSGDFRFLRTPCLRIAVPSAISNLLYKNNPPPAPIRTGAPANRTFDGGRRR